MPTFGLVDCNNFYASCERVFQPKLRDKPVIVLSNNDGCVVSRSQEAKALGIGMGVPLFQVRDIVKRNAVAVLSSNYALYGDLSHRVMTVLGDAAPRHEVYSIDECFLDLEGMPDIDLSAWCRDLKAQAQRWTGIPVSVGIGPTKTLAKIANRLAKTSPRTGGVLDLASNPDWREAALRKTEARDVWGIGFKLSAMLFARGIKTAHDLSQAQDGWVRQRMGVVGLRVVHELRGTSCHDLESEPPAKQTTCCSRTFAEAVTEKGTVRDAVSGFAQRAAEKIRTGEQVCGALQVFLHTDRFRKEKPQLSVQGSASFLTATSDSIEIASAALRVVDRLWRDGYEWRKAGVILIDLTTPEDAAASLFTPRATPSPLMAALDDVNDRFGSGSIGLGLSPKRAKWRMRQEMVSPRFTTRWSDIPKASAADPEAVGSLL